MNQSDVSNTILYKYLDANGGLMMLKHHNLQFTNATRLNDPFDCHPSLIDYSNASNIEAKVWGKKLVEEVEMSRATNRRNDAWICSLSKNCNSLLMWSYYNSHKGVCIGLNREKTKACLSHVMNGVYIGAMELEVGYKDIIKKPDYFQDHLDDLKYQLSTKAIDWSHEQEVRLLLIDPTPAVVPHHPCFAIMALPYKPKDKNEVIDWKELRAYTELSADCFESIYLGVNMNEKDKKKVVNVAQKCNPNIRIYQMTIDPNAFRLKEIDITKK